MNRGLSFYVFLTIATSYVILLVSLLPSTVWAESSLSLTKTAVDPSFNDDGITLHYTLEATNTSTADETLTNVTITDAKLGALECTPEQPATLAPGGTLSCTGTYTTTQVDVDAGFVTNTATAAADGITTIEELALVIALQSPTLSIAKSADPTTYSAVGEKIDYTFQLTNSGNVTLEGPFMVTDDKVTVTCPVTTSLAPGNLITCTASHTITQADLDAGSIINTAYATASFDGGIVTSLDDDVTVNATQDTTLTLDKSTTTTGYDSVGDPLSYSYKLTNNGNVVLSGPFTISDDKATVSCPSTATMDPGAFINCSATYTIIQVDLNAGSVTNTATGHASFTGSPVDSNQDSVTINATQSPHLTLLKTATQTSYKAIGQLLHYQLKATNNGNVTLTNVNIVDPKLGALTCDSPGQGGTLTPGSFLSCTGTYTITQADLNAKSVTNTATSEGEFGGDPIQPASDTETVFGATFTVSPTSGLLTFEDGTTDTFTIKLDKKPSANVVLNISSGTTSDEASVSPTTLTFTPGEWTPSQTKTVTVQGVNDNLADGPQPFTINMTNVSSGPDYSGVNPPPVTGTNGDNDTAGLTVSPLSGLITTEGKSSAKIQVKLNTQPTADVTLNFSSSKPTEGTVAPVSLVIKPADWNLVKEVTITGVDDKVPDGNQNYQINITTESSDGNYNNKQTSVSATNWDAPTVMWSAPVLTGQIYEISNLVPFLLKVLEDGSEPITRVRFYRWDAVKETHVNIGEILNPPYQIIYDPAKNGNLLNPEFNQFFTVAYNAANVASENIHIWVYKQGNTRTVYLPIAVQNR